MITKRNNGNILINDIMISTEHTITQITSQNTGNTSQNTGNTLPQKRMKKFDIIYDLQHSRITYSRLQYMLTKLVDYLIYLDFSIFIHHNDFNSFMIFTEKLILILP